MRDTIDVIVRRRLARREVMKSMLASGVTALFLPSSAGTARATTDRFPFAELAAGVDETHHVASGYRADVLLRWGDPLFVDSPAFDPRAQTAADQLRQFGYNNDFVGFVPLGDGKTRGLLCVNHETTNAELMFPGAAKRNESGFAETADLVSIEMAAHGASIVEIALRNDRWEVERTSRFNRRISALSTRMEADGPAAGDGRLQTRSDPSGREILGTLNNCGGAITPWRSYLTAEENFHNYFWTERKDAYGRRLRRGLGGPQEASYDRYGIPSNKYCWGRFDKRFDVDREPNEPNRFGWIVEVDPLDPASKPVKHTALGRFSHEAAATTVNADGRVVVYMGDDSEFEYLYRFVSSGRFDPADRAGNMTLLSSGTLSVARFEDDGAMQWLPLTYGVGPLVPAHGFASQADVLIDTRLAADLLGATPMDRPEDVEANPVTGRVYAMLTKNKDRASGEEDAANPRAANPYGHVIELQPPQGDHAADVFAWDFLLLCGDPAVADAKARWHPATSEAGWFTSPDNCVFDSQGRLWVATDQGNGWNLTGKADGLYGVETEGELRGRSKLFFRCPVGAELCGPCFTPDDETLFVSVQHPGVAGAENYPGFERPSTFEDPVTRWPDFDESLPPRPSVVAIRKDRTR